MTEAAQALADARELRRIAEQEERECWRLMAMRDKGWLLPMVQYTSRDYLAGWVHADICAHLEAFSEAVARQESPRLMISMPPRHGKTHIVSQRFPVAHLARHPGHEVVCASYGQELANDNSDAARDVAKGTAPDIWPDVRPAPPGKSFVTGHRRPTADRINFWRTGNGGSYKAVGVGGPLTGRGAHVLIFDDLIKNMSAAESPAERKRLWSWYQSTARTRLAPGGGIIMMATRWHVDDPSGRLLASQGDEWAQVTYAAIAERDEAHRRAGEALHPERYPLRMLEKIRDDVGSRVWASLYQQRPTPLEGGLFKREWFEQFWHVLPALDGQLISVDATFKGGKGSDFVVMQCWGHVGADRYLIDQLRGRMSYAETKQALIAFAARHPEAKVKVIEDKANGPALISDLRSTLSGLVAYNPRESKQARAQLVAVDFEAGNVYLPHPNNAPWVLDYIEELCTFPQGANDDQVDATSQALIRIDSHGDFGVDVLVG